MTRRDRSPLLAGTDSEHDEFDDGYYEGDQDAHDRLDFEEDEEQSYHEFDEDGIDWDDAIERNEEDGWFYDDDDREELKRESYSCDE